MNNTSSFDLPRANLWFDIIDILIYSRQLTSSGPSTMATRSQRKDLSPWWPQVLTARPSLSLGSMTTPGRFSRRRDPTSTPAGRSTWSACAPVTRAGCWTTPGWSPRPAAMCWTSGTRSGGRRREIWSPATTWWGQMAPPTVTYNLVNFQYLLERDVMITRLSLILLRSLLTSSGSTPMICPANVCRKENQR